LKSNAQRGHLKPFFTTDFLSTFSMQPGHQIRILPPGCVDAPWGLKTLEV
jgi:hypothetical protein